MNEMKSGKRMIYREKLRELMEISEEAEETTFFDEELKETLIDKILDGTLVVGFKKGEIAFSLNKNE